MYVLVAQPAMLAEFLFQPPFDPLRTGALGAAVLVLAATVYARTRALPAGVRSALGLARVAVIGTLVVILFGPAGARWFSEENYRRKLVIALDTSCSFATDDVDGRPRWDVAREHWLDPDWINALRRRHDLRFYRFDSKAEPTSLGALASIDSPEGRHTHLTAAIRHILNTEFARGPESAGLVVISDGHETGLGDPVATGTAAREQGVPLWTCCYGRQTQTRDVALQTFRGREWLFVNQTGQLGAKLLQTGYGNDEVRVTLERDGELVQEQRLFFQNRATADVTFAIREDTPGTYEYALRADPLAGEADPENNARTVFITVTNERVRVLLVEGQPYWDTKFLGQALRGDRQIELTQVVRYGRGRFHAIRTSHKAGDADAQETPVLAPRTKEELFAYDVLIFGKRIEEFIAPEHLDWLAEFLSERGGGVVFARARAYDITTPEGMAAARRLRPLEPAEWGERYIESLRMELTPEGRMHPSFQFSADKPADVIIADLPQLVGAVRVRREKAAALILARARGDDLAAQTPMAAVAYQNFGAGRVVSVLSEGLWRWAFLPRDPDAVDGATPYDFFWRRMVHWLAGTSEFLPGQDVALSVPEFPEGPGHPVTIVARMRHVPRPDTPAELAVTTPAGRTQRLALTRRGEAIITATASFEPADPGVYSVRLDAPQMTPSSQTARFCVYDYSAERVHRGADPGTMRALAEASGGAVISPTNPRELLPHLNAAHPTGARTRDVDYVWDQPWVLTLLIALLTIEWAVRRRRGLP
jgi:hypothetical protein